MRILGSIVTLLLLAIPGLPAATFSGSTEVREKLAEAVISAEEKQIQILEDLIETGDPFISKVLTAWRRGELFLIEHEGSTIPALLENADSKEPVKVFILESGEVLKDFKGPGGFFSSAAMSPDGKRIVYGCGTGEVVVMEAESGKVLNKYEEHELGVMSVAISADGKRFVSGSDDKTFRIRKLDTNPEKK